MNSFNNYLEQNLSCEGVVENLGNGEYLIKGKIANGSKDALITYWAANPAGFITSYNGNINFFTIVGQDYVVQVGV